MPRPKYKEYCALTSEEQGEMLSLISSHGEKHHALMWIIKHRKCETIEGFVLTDYMWGKYQQMRLDDADGRGVLEAAVNSQNWVRCPYCDGSFQVTNPALWDGTRHRSCLTALNLTSC